MIIRHKTRHRISVATAAVVVSGLFASPALAAPPTDAEVRRAVSQSMVEDPGVFGYRIDASVSDGVVTLTGTVGNILAKDRAVRLAETIKGVRSVVDRIKIRTPEVTDRELRNDVVAALASDPATDSWELDVSVNDGFVALTGSVESLAEKELATTVAKGVQGVTAVSNNVEITYDPVRPPSEIEVEIESLLRWNALVDDSLIDVEVDGTEVILSGTVGSAAERREARSTAWGAGVHSVDTSGLEVRSWARDERFRSGKYEAKPDSQIAEAIRDALVVDPRVLSFDIDVGVENAVATLEGEVDNLKAKRAATRTARHTVGVRRVENLIRVRTDDLTDKTLSANVRDALLRDPYIERYEIDVEAHNGEVFLYGTVDSSFEKAQADDVASRVEGVVDVNNNLVVSDEQDPLAYDPYIGDYWFPFTYSWHRQPREYNTIMTDLEIKEEIESELFWSPFVNSDDIEVTVKRGEARLTGTVDSWNEKWVARENAYEGGALFVDNRIVVNPDSE